MPSLRISVGKFLPSPTQSVVSIPSTRFSIFSFVIHEVELGLMRDHWIIGHLFVDRKGVKNEGDVGGWQTWYYSDLVFKTCPPSLTRDRTGTKVGYNEVDFVFKTIVSILTFLGYVWNKPCWQFLVDKTLSSHCQSVTSVYEIPFFWISDIFLFFEWENARGLQKNVGKMWGLQNNAVHVNLQLAHRLWQASSTHGCGKCPHHGQARAGLDRCASSCNSWVTSWRSNCTIYIHLRTSIYEHLGKYLEERGCPKHRWSVAQPGRKRGRACFGAQRPVDIQHGCCRHKWQDCPTSHVWLDKF